MKHILEYGAVAALLAYAAWLVALNCRSFWRSRPPRERAPFLRRHLPRRVTAGLALAPLLLLSLPGVASAHFVFILPEPAGPGATGVKVVMSEELKPDEDLDAGPLARAALTVRAAGKGHDASLAALKLKRGEHECTAELPAGDGTRIVSGQLEWGVRAMGGGKPYLLIYYPKAVIGDAFGPAATLGAAAPVELVASGKPGALQLGALAAGKPVADVEVHVILPSGKSKVVKTDGDGLTPAFEANGRYGAWAKQVEPGSGESGGQKYEEVRRYATLVADIGAAPASAKQAGPAGSPAAEAITARPFAHLPEPASSFGAVALDGWLYVYGGHIVKTHQYSTAAVSGRFSRLKLADGKTWENLPAGPSLQGMNLAAYDGKVYRIGGMQPRNAPGEPADNYSVADCACYDPAAGKWEPLPSLPEPRSSHDVAVVGSKLYVLGGWRLNGKAGEAAWPKSALVLDLKADHPQWASVPQPFQRRALTAAAWRGKVYALGGFTEESSPESKVEIYDPAAGTWATGPDLPGPARNGFGPAAIAAGDGLYVSVGDGSLYRLAGDGKAWEKVAAGAPRIVHRIAPAGADMLVIGGAAKGDNLDVIEAIPLKPVSAAR